MVAGHIGGAAAPAFDVSWAWVAGGLASNGADICNWLTHLYGSGDVVDSEWLSEMVRPTQASILGGQAYGLGTRVTSMAGVRVLGHTGSTMGFDGQAFIEPHSGVCVAVLTNDFFGVPDVVAAHVWDAILAWDVPGAEAPSPFVAVSGNAFNFTTGGGPFKEGGRVTVRELPGVETVTGPKGAWAFAGLPRGADVTFVIDAEDHPILQTGTFTLDGDLERVTFQSPDTATYNLLATVAGIDLDRTKCQIATTVTRRCNSLYVVTKGPHGEPGATVSAEPAIPASSGPIYFNLVEGGVIYPDTALTETTEDGGALWANVEPGTYTLHAQKDGATIRSVKIRCDAGVITNPSPPWGLQTLEGGMGPRNPAENCPP